MFAGENRNDRLDYLQRPIDENMQVIPIVHR
jgi:hypothetical protein